MSTAEAWAAWAAVPETEDHGWVVIGTNRWGDVVYELTEDTVTVQAHRQGNGRYQVWVTGGCGGTHAFPVDSLDEAATQGLTVCARMSKGQDNGRRR